ncbi:Nuclear transcription factor Y subunit A-1 [Capsicum annuum]|uniref:Nuclear transcription factor Y subunit n=1 Tax=Capsicum annuum TaxID=4072 RepID=A0A1U8DRR5_CAPAN|nr:nuclear transcription factor Y subunit A-3 isoform X1 [Capsicum annuum]XP_047251696.1 nuclear transcription factor Y subunit A-3 isoform X1 [Capsicum annuum]XP_047251697.1 nuclear transcription factor Y subunit A-3 isoform X1 [Capsicum annuum]XP_047251698.1 nuclear transcription factor Y subunit A-3 isoform X1 [Capsicum annuum]KAF3628233.1 Nuclear transcription factor Y subunit A-1 [Capsicum annuum]KAF3630294.1 Nuclear transcription factor Y subunit A-1 [Capsicum annuum]PHT74172.1 Nuclear 
MLSFSKKGCPGKESQSFTPLFVSCSSMWNSSEKSALKHHSDIKKSESQFQDLDSTSTLSTGQSNHVEAAMGKSNTVLQNVAAHPGWGGIYDLQEETGTNASLSGESDTNTLPQLQVHHNHPAACVSYPWADSYFGRLISTYESNAINYPQRAGVTSTRVALPLDCTESLPIYVNAKQYNAILKRRQVRAKLEAQNKLVKDRKPYLHDSRHRHAMERARGSGGRFLNTKNMQQSNPSSPKHDKNIFKQQAGAMVQHSESGSWGTSTQSGSDVTSIFNDDDMFRQPEFRVSGFPFHMQEAEDFMHVGT